MRKIRLLSLLLLLLLLSACAQTAPPEPSPTEIVAQANPTETALPEPTATSEPEPAPTEAATLIPPTETPLPEPTATSEPEPTATSEAATPAPSATPLPTATAEATIGPIEVTYFSPRQAEGPYYTVEKPADRDNNLIEVAGATAAPAGEVLDFTGHLYDADGWPVANGVIEIWQTDNYGIYLHPNDPNTAQRDVNFQFYGEAVTADDGSYSFRTILPGKYEPRPRHIHVKVKVEGQELLTTQFYFEGDENLSRDSLYANAGEDGLAMMMSISEGTDSNGNPILIGERDIVLSVALR